jgi:hypothetical protein
MAGKHPKRWVKIVVLGLLGLPGMIVTGIVICCERLRRWWTYA